MTNEKGVSIIETIVALGIFSTVGMSLAYTSILHLNTRAGFVRRTASEQLAMEALEDYAQINPAVLFDDSDVTETGLSRNGMVFSRSIDVSINSNRTRLIAVTVTNDATGSSLTLSGSYALWDKR